MKIENQVLQMLDGTTVILEAKTKTSNMVDKVLMEVTGWDDFSMQIQTAPKLVGSGSYIISRDIGEREVTITFNMIGDWKALRRQLTALAIASKEITLVLSVTDSTNKTIKETLKGEIFKIAPARATREWADLKIHLICPNPIIQQT